MRLNTLSPAPGRIKEAKRAGRGIGSGLVRPVVEGTRARSQGLEGLYGQDLKVDKCLYRSAFQSMGLHLVWQP